MTLRPSSQVLIAANLLPLIGVAFFEWDILALLLLYWIESVIVGLMNVLRMICTNEHNMLEGLGEPHELPGFKHVHEVNQYQSANSAKFIYVPFFIVHYGGFCFGHASFIVGMFGPGSSINPRIGAALSELWHGPFSIAVGAIFASHVYSFFKNYIGGGEYARANLHLLMFRPYGRIIVMHLTILIGATLTMVLGSPLPVMMFLIGGKILIDMHLHNKERAKLAADD